MRNHHLKNEGKRFYSWDSSFFGKRTTSRFKLLDWTSQSQAIECPWRYAASAPRPPDAIPRPSIFSHQKSDRRCNPSQFVTSQQPRWGVDPIYNLKQPIWKDIDTSLNRILSPFWGDKKKTSTTQNLCFPQPITTNPNPSRTEVQPCLISWPLWAFAPEKSRWVCGPWANEPRKNPPTFHWGFHYTGCLTGILLMIYYLHVPPAH